MSKRNDRETADPLTALSYVVAPEIQTGEGFEPSSFSRELPPVDRCLVDSTWSCVAYDNAPGIPSDELQAIDDRGRGVVYRRRVRVAILEDHVSSTYSLCIPSLPRSEPDRRPRSDVAVLFLIIPHSKL